MIRMALASILLVSGLPLTFAQHAGTPQEQQACSRDSSRFCRKYFGDDNAVQRCLQQHRTSLSAACLRPVNPDDKHAALVGNVGYCR